MCMLLIVGPKNRKCLKKQFWIFTVIWDSQNESKSYTSIHEKREATMLSTSCGDAQKQQECTLGPAGMLVGRRAARHRVNEVIAHDRNMVK